MQSGDKPGISQTRKFRGKRAPSSLGGRLSIFYQPEKKEGQARCLPPMNNAVRNLPVAESSTTKTKQIQFRPSCLPSAGLILHGLRNQLAKSSSSRKCICWKDRRRDSTQYGTSPLPFRTGMEEAQPPPQLRPQLNAVFLSVSSQQPSLL